MSDVTIPRAFSCGMRRLRSGSVDRPRGEEPAEGRVVARLADGDERVAGLDDVVRLGARDGLRLPQDGDDRDPGARAEAALGERPADRRAVVRDGDPLDRQLAERHLQLLDDARPLVRAADDGAQLAGLVVVEVDDRPRLVVAGTAGEGNIPPGLVLGGYREPA